MSDYRATINEVFEATRAKRKKYFEALDADPDNPPVLEPAEPFTNPSFSHANLVLTKLVRVSERELLILCGDLMSACHSALRLTAQIKRHPGLSVRILVESDKDGPIFQDGHVDWPKLANSALVDLATLVLGGEDNFVATDGKPSPGRIAVRVLPIKSEIHFTVSDRFAFRIEHDRHNGEGNVNPMDPPTASLLAERFDTLWTLSTPIAFPQPRNIAA